MQSFRHEGFDLAFIDQQPASGNGQPVLLIHGFASNHFTNWVSPGWVKTLTDAGYRAIALDNRGMAARRRATITSDYHPDRMAGDAAALLAHLGIAARMCSATRWAPASAPSWRWPSRNSWRR